MAFRPRTAELPAEEAAVEKIDLHPEFAKLATMRTAITAALTRRRQQIELQALEAGIARPTTSQSGPRVAMLKERAATLRQLLQQPEAQEDSGGLPLPLRRAMELAGGGEVEEPETDTKRTARLRVEEQLLEQGLNSISEQMDALRDTLSLEVAERLAPTHRAVLKTVWQAASELSAALDRESEVFASAIIAGYAPRPDILRRPGLRSGALLGSMQMWDSEVRGLERRLREQGVLP